MNEEWKRFIIQWIVPVGIFGVVLVFLFASFDANIKQKASDTYKGDLVGATSTYASDICTSVQKSEAVARMAADVIVEKNMPMNETIFMLDNIVEYSDAYMAVITNGVGKGFDNNGESINLLVQPYFKSVFGNQMYSFQFVNDDGITGEAAMVLSISASNRMDTQRVLVYYPMNSAAIKKIVKAEEQFDANAGIVITTDEGEVLVSSRASLGCTEGINIWDKMSSGNNAATIRRSKNKVQSGSAGTFEVLMNNVGYCVCYAAIPGTNQELMVFFADSSVAKAENRIYKSSLNKLGLVVLAIVVFIIAVTIINIIQICVNSKNQDDLKDKADNDQLTGLKNKIATEREIKDYIEHNPDSLAMMFLVDIDNFKKINDTMGHAFGDEVLRELGRHIGINFRVSDIIGRTGGDEFTIFLKNLKEDGNTLKEAQKLVYFFKHFQVGDYVKYTVTASIGAAVFPTHGADFETLYKSADAAVYKSKKRGKNQLSFYDDRDRTPEEVAYADSHLIDIERKTDEE